MYPPVLRLPTAHSTRNQLRKINERVAYYLLNKPTAFARTCSAHYTEGEFAEFQLDDPEFLQLIRSTPLVYMLGWSFRSHKNFEKHGDAIRDYFTPRLLHQKKVSQCLDRVRSQGETIVGIHIRHGDYSTYLGGRYYYSIEQYIRLMRGVGDLFSGKQVVYLVCSNSQFSANDFPGLNVVIGNGHIIEDMYSFAQCDYLLGPVSTYTLWASFYGEVPLYRVENPDRDFSLSDFKTYLDG